MREFVLLPDGCRLLLLLLLLLLPVAL
eukprot:COSAG01_NODE_58465_length_306_cov_0.396135_1_plen_26_part_01